MDTSAIMDVRFKNLYTDGFIHRPILIPSQVSRELDSFVNNDAIKYLKQRNLAKAALKILSSIKDLEYDEQFGEEDADDQVVLLAIKHHYQVVSLDKVVLDQARQKRADFLSYDQLFLHARPDITKGDVISLRLLYQMNKHDAAAFTEYGNLVIVEDGLSRLGSSVSVRIISITKHGHGRAYFGEINTSS